MQQGTVNVNNTINIVGKIVSPCEFSHEVFGENFYIFKLEAHRLSDISDVLPVTISDRLMNRADFAEGNTVAIRGQVRSYNSFVESENRNRLVLTIFARDYELVEADDPRNPNEVFLNGYICKPPVYRTTPFGREIADLLVAVNRSYNKSDYIPCISWGRNARFAGKLSVGENVKLLGRMQSRAYQKKNEHGEVIDKIAYEVSVSRLEYDAGTEESEEFPEEE